MSKASKTRRAIERAKVKKNRKAAAQALYDSYKAAGNNTKSKRKSLSDKRKRQVRNVRHASGACNNVGCSACQPDLNASWNEAFPKATKSWKTSAEKIAQYSQKLLSERGGQVEISPEEAKARLLKLDERLGIGEGASRERARLVARLAV